MKTNRDLKNWLVGGVCLLVACATTTATYRDTDLEVDHEFRNRYLRECLAENPRDCVAESLALCRVPDFEGTAVSKAKALNDLAEAAFGTPYPVASTSLNTTWFQELQSEVASRSGGKVRLEMADPDTFPHNKKYPRTSESGPTQFWQLDCGGSVDYPEVLRFYFYDAKYGWAFAAVPEDNEGLFTVKLYRGTLSK